MQTNGRDRKLAHVQERLRGLSCGAHKWPLSEAPDEYRLARGQTT